MWIHGGAFIFGGIGVYNPEYIMEENVVLVTIQYRLNIFGFMSTEDSVAPGNYGKSIKNCTDPAMFSLMLCSQRQTFVG